MHKRLRYKDIVWIDLESPTEEDIAAIAREFDLHPVALNELRTLSPRSKLDVYTNFIYLVLHFPLCQLCRGETLTDGRKNQEIDFVVGKNYIITTHYESINPLLDLAKIFESEMSLTRYKDKPQASHIFFYLLREMYRSLEEGLQYINDRLTTIEGQIFTNQEKTMVKELADVNHNLLDFRGALKPHRDLIDALQKVGEEFFGQQFSFYLQTIRIEYEKIWHLVQANRDLFLDLRDTNDSLLTIRNNDLMRFVSVMAFVFLPMTLIIQLFGMNTDSPVAALGRAGFYVVIVMAVLITGVMYLVARRRRWL